MSDLIFRNENEDNSVYKDPLKFIDTLHKSKHIVLYYENEEFSRRIEHRFIKNGLKNGETCIYFMHGDKISLIENEMRINDVDVEYYIERGLLKILKIPNIMEHPEGAMRGAQEIIDKMLLELRPPFRLVDNLLSEITSEEQIEANLALEHYYHSELDKIDGMILCPYDIKKSPTSTQGKWVEIILENHHSVILVTDTSDEGIAIDAD